MRTLNLPPTEAYLPTTFAERGLAVPFTSPLLAGVRVRASQRTGTELVVPNPSGGRGVYIVPWDAIKELGRPTLHDTMLYRGIGQAAALTPDAVRRAGIEMATKGLAGAAARKAADTLRAVDDGDRSMANFLLVLCLVEQFEPSGTVISVKTPRPPKLDERAKHAIARIAVTLGLSRELIATELEKLGCVFAGIGVSTDAVHPRIPGLLTRLARLRSGIAAWVACNREFHDVAVADSIAASAEQVTTYANATLRDARRLTNDMFGLLRGWFSRRDEVASQISRVKWLLDGWEAICLLWEAPQPASKRRATLLEMAHLVPYLPRETVDWVRMEINPNALEPGCRVMPMQDDWRAGSALIALVARNERLRAMSR